MKDPCGIFLNHGPCHSDSLLVLLHFLVRSCLACSSLPLSVLPSLPPPCCYTPSLPTPCSYTPSLPTPCSCTFSLPLVGGVLSQVPGGQQGDKEETGKQHQDGGDNWCGSLVLESLQGCGVCHERTGCNLNSVMSVWSLVLVCVSHTELLVQDTSGYKAPRYGFLLVH